MLTEQRRVVVTGIGPVTSLGQGVQDVWSALTAGRSGIGPIENVDASTMPVKIAAEVKGFDPSTWMSPKEARHTDRVVHLAVAAARIALEDAGTPGIEPDRAGVYISTGIGGIATTPANPPTLLGKGPERGSPPMGPPPMPHAAAAPGRPPAP